MSLWTVFLIAIGVSVDAFAAAMTIGLRMHRPHPRGCAVVALTFAGFQMAMPLFGWALASHFSRLLDPVDHWIAFGLLVLIGGKMIADSLRSQEMETSVLRTGCGRLLLLGVATSIDAAAVGVSFAVLDVAIVPAILIIGATTLALSLAAVVLGQRIGVRFRAPAEFIGGVVLVLIGVRILFDHFVAA